MKLNATNRDSNFVNLFMQFAGRLKKPPNKGKDQMITVNFVRVANLHVQPASTPGPT